MKGPQSARPVRAQPTRWDRRDAAGGVSVLSSFLAIPACPASNEMSRTSQADPTVGRLLLLQSECTLLSILKLGTVIRSITGTVCESLRIAYTIRSEYAGRQASYCDVHMTLYE
jgi:hypothetical protein